LEFEASLGYTVSPCLKKKKKTNIKLCCILDGDVLMALGAQKSQRRREEQWETCSNVTWVQGRGAGKGCREGVQKGHM
jgi:hypothetical protein